MPGDIIISFETMRGLHEHVAHARGRHRWPDDYDPVKMYRAAESELHEMGTAMLKGDWRGTVAEALDFAAVGVRIAEYGLRKEGSCEKTSADDMQMRRQIKHSEL